MNKYIQLKGTQVTSVIVADSQPTDGEGYTYKSTTGIDPLPSRDWRYDTASTAYYGPISYRLNGVNEYSSDGNILLSGSSLNSDVTCSFSREVSTLTISDINTGSLKVTNFNHDVSNANLSFNIETGSETGTSTESIIFKTPLIDTYGWKWDSNSIEVEIEI